MSPSRTSSAVLMKPTRASTTPKAATSTAPSWRAIHRAKTRAARRAVVIDRFDASRADRKEFRLNGLPDLAGYELDQPYSRIISLGVWAPFPSAVNVAGVRGAPPRRAVADDPADICSRSRRHSRMRSARERKPSRTTTFAPAFGGI